MTAHPFALLASLVLAQDPPTEDESSRPRPKDTYEISLRTEARSRAPDPSTSSTFVAGDLQLDGTVGGSFGRENARTSIVYSPRLLIVEPYGRAKTEVMHRGQVGWDLQFSSGRRIRASEQFSYGLNDFSPLVATAGTPPSLDRLPEVRTVRYVESNSSVGLDYDISPRLRGAFTAAYLIGGGADETARAFIPLQSGPTLSGRLNWLQSPRDTLSGGLIASYVDSSNDRSAVLLDLLATWQRLLEPRTQTELGVGVAASHEWGLRHRDAILPAALAGIKHQIPLRSRQIEWNARVRIAPVIDRISGTVYTRLEGTAGLNYDPRPDVRLNAYAGTSVAVSGDVSGDKLGFAALGASYKINPHFSLDAGARGSWIYNSVFSGGFTWAGFVSATVSDHGSL